MNELLKTKKKSWRSTLGGALLAIGLLGGGSSELSALQTIIPPEVRVVLTMTGAVGGLLLGKAAKDEAAE